MSLTSESDATSAAAADASASAAAAVAPSRADGIELLGELPGSGYRVPPALVRRQDGQTIQLTRLLHLVLEAVDGHRGPEEIATVVSQRFGRRLTSEDVLTLLEGKLRPLGLLAGPDGSQPQVRKANPLLALRLRYVVSDPAVTRRLTGPFAALFHPVVVTLVVLAFLATSGWVLFEKGLASATHEAFARPGLLLLIFAVTVVSAGFHEFGHASACRYGGATPGAMGAGLYLVWPAFYTDVTDSYRLGKAGRVRVDLGGLYFNAIVAVAMFGIWAGTRWDALLLVLVAQVLQMIRQLAPFVRFDGYHILADLTGVPDLYARIKPTLLGLWPPRWHSPEARVLKPWARAVVSAWVLVVVPMLLVSMVLMVVALPRVVGTAWVNLGRQWAALDTAWAAGDVARVGVRLLSVVAIALPVLASAYLLLRIVRRVVRSVWRSTRGHPVRRALAGLLALVLVGLLAWAWAPTPGRYRPIQPSERGTLVDAVPVRAAAGLQEGRQVRAAHTVWASRMPLPTADHPRLAMVLVPRPRVAAGSAAPQAAAPAWVFPFNPPGAPGQGDNQALAVNTTDGSTLYDVAFALVWADDGSVTNRNEAWALASCRSCRTVAVAFQVVLVVGQADVAIPQNISAAVNYRCLQCLTYALAHQVVITLPRELTPQETARLDALWTQIAAFGTHLQDLPLDQIRGRLDDFADQIRSVLQQSPPAPPTPSATSPASVGGTAPASAGPEASATPTPTGTAPEPAGTTAPAPVPTAPSTASGTDSPAPGDTAPEATATPTASTTTSEPAPTSTASGTATG